MIGAALVALALGGGLLVQPAARTRGPVTLEVGRLSCGAYAVDSFAGETRRLRLHAFVCFVTDSTTTELTGAIQTRTGAVRCTLDGGFDPPSGCVVVRRNGPGTVCRGGGWACCPPDGGACSAGSLDDPPPIADDPTKQVAP